MTQVGCTSVSVFATPRVGVVSTGDELVEPGSGKLPAGKIRDSNRLMLLAAVREAGATPVDFGAQPCHSTVEARRC